MGKFDELEDDGLVLSEEFTRSNSEDERVSNVTSGSSYGDSDGSFLVFLDNKEG